MKTKVTITTHEIDHPVRLSIPVNLFMAVHPFFLWVHYSYLFWYTVLCDTVLFFCGTGTLFSLFFVFALFLFFPRLGSGLSGTGMGSSSVVVDSGESYSL